MKNKAIFEILRAGTFNGGTGTHTFTRYDLAMLAKMYDEKVRAAPLVIGHPEDDLPQFGRVTKIYHHDDQLFAEAEILLELVQRIKGGEISGISSGIYFSQNTENPVCGLCCYLKHVGFLERGKDEPAVKGMMNPQASVHFANLSSDKTIAFLSAGDYKGDPALGEMNQRVLYFQNALGVDYRTALDVVSQRKWG